MYKQYIINSNISIIRIILNTLQQKNISSQVPLELRCFFKHEESIQKTMVVGQGFVFLEVFILQFHFYKGQLKFKLKGIQKHWFLYIIKKAAKGCTADLLLAYKPVQQVAITVHVAILALQACLVSHTRHLNPPTGTKKFQETKKLGYYKYLKNPNNHE